MKKLLCAALALVMTAALCACGGTGAPDSPYVGVWTAAAARFGDMDVDIGEVFPDGMVLELKESGVCQLTLGDQSDPASWSETDGQITISDGENDLLGVVEEDAIILDISGMSIILTREGAEAPAGEEPAEEGAVPEETATEEEG